MSAIKQRGHLLEILQHALGRNKFGKSKSVRDYRNHYCASEGSADFEVCRYAVAAGLMVERQPSEISGGDYLFTVTDAGRQYITEHSPPEPRRTRGQERYRQYLNADCTMTFGDWLRRGGR